MRSFSIRLGVGLITFVAGVSLSLFWFSRSTPRVVITPMLVTEARDLSVERKPDCALALQTSETPEEKAVRLAEEFVARNGYTDLPPDKNSLSYENIEWADGVDEMLETRHDTLERKAHGLRYGAKMGEPGWTVVFRYTKRIGSAGGKAGRAVTMNENFQIHRVEHCDFFLDKVEKKLGASR